MRLQGYMLGTQGTAYLKTIHCAVVRVQQELGQANDLCRWAETVQIKLEIIMLQISNSLILFSQFSPIILIFSSYRNYTVTQVQLAPYDIIKCNC